MMSKTKTHEALTLLTLAQSLHHSLFAGKPIHLGTSQSSLIAPLTSALESIRYLKNWDLVAVNFDHITLP
ncbi:unnamed protein product [Lactuca virosa]|uniref:Uncharacterized protein n=1 Tax=Lactuca virosa TaxID=75947 RepID=A0AAU9NBY2_9ASTR|nr:unnamed protein product [Lactuca virosa]